MFVRISIFSPVQFEALHQGVRILFLDHHLTPQTHKTLGMILVLSSHLRNTARVLISVIPQRKTSSRSQGHPLLHLHPSYTTPCHDHVLSGLGCFAHVRLIVLAAFFFCFLTCLCLNLPAVSDAMQSAPPYSLGLYTSSLFHTHTHTHAVYCSEQFRFLGKHVVLLLAVPASQQLPTAPSPTLYFIHGYFSQPCLFIVPFHCSFNSLVHYTAH